MTSYRSGGADAAPVHPDLGVHASSAALAALTSHFNISITTSLPAALAGQADYFLWSGEYPGDEDGRYWVRGLIRSSDLPALLREAHEKGVKKAQDEGKPRPTMDDTIDSFRRFRTGWENKWVAHYIGWVVEIDHLPRAEQERMYADLSAATGLRWSLKVFSGGKSVHAYLSPDRLLDPEDPKDPKDSIISDVEHLLWALLEGDFAVARGNLSRLPGWDGPHRKQPVVHLDPTAHHDAPEVIRDLLATYAASMGITDPYEAVAALRLAKRLFDRAAYWPTTAAAVQPLVDRLRATRGAPTDADIELASAGSQTLKLARDLVREGNKCGGEAGQDMREHADVLASTWDCPAKDDLDLAKAMLGAGIAGRSLGVLRGSGRKGDPLTYFIPLEALEPYRHLPRGSSHLESPGCCEDSEVATYHEPGSTPRLHCYSCGHAIRPESSLPAAVRDAPVGVIFGFDGGEVEVAPARPPVMTDAERIADAQTYLSEKRRAKDEASRQRIAQIQIEEAARDAAERALYPPAPYALTLDEWSEADTAEAVDHYPEWGAYLRSLQVAEPGAVPVALIEATTAVFHRRDTRVPARRAKMRAAGLTGRGKHCGHIHRSLVHAQTGAPKAVSHRCRGVGCIVCGPKVIETKAAAITTMPVVNHGQIVGGPLGEREVVYEIRLRDRGALAYWQELFSEAKSKLEDEVREFPNTLSSGSLLGNSRISPPVLLSAPAYVVFDAEHPVDPQGVTRGSTPAEVTALDALRADVDAARAHVTQATSKRARAAAEAAVRRAERALTRAEVQAQQAAEARAARAASTIVVLSTLPVLGARDKQIVTAWTGEQVQDRVDELVDWTYRVTTDEIGRAQVTGSISSSRGLYLDPDTIYEQANPSLWRVERPRTCSPAQAARIAQDMGYSLTSVRTCAEDATLEVVGVAMSVALAHLPTRMKFLAALEKGEVDTTPIPTRVDDAEKMDEALAQFLGEDTPAPRKKEVG